MVILFRFISRSRSLKNLVHRVVAVLSRFGFSAKPFKCRLYRYCALAEKVGFVPSFPITAVTLKRHCGVIGKLIQQGVEFAVHGFIHNDHKPLSREEQTRYFKMAMHIFRNCGVNFSGFRAPFLRINNETPKVLYDLDFLYDSSHVIRWDVVDMSRHSQQAQKEYQRLLDFYDAESATKHLVLPQFIDDLVEIPVSIPDDEAVIDRLGIKDEKEITQLWQAILDESYHGGELFTVQLHPERITYFESTLAQIIQEAKKRNPPVWIATLSEIAQWWHERRMDSLKVDRSDGGKYNVKVTCGDRATILIKNCQADIATTEWWGGYQSTSSRSFSVECSKPPVIGVAPDTALAALSFLNREGFVVEKSEQRDNYAVYLDNLMEFSETNEKYLTKMIENAGAPLVRFWRWPCQARSALTVTGDIDSMTLVDFILRYIETWLLRFK